MINNYLSPWSVNNEFIAFNKNHVFFFKVYIALYLQIKHLFIFYFLFLSMLQGECGYPDCMQALGINLGIIFGKWQKLLILHRPVHIFSTF